MAEEQNIDCPLCMEPLEMDDLNFFPCTCGYQICRFCWHRIRTDENGLCPACRKPYPEDPADFKPLTTEELQKIKSEKKQKDQQRKQKLQENRKHLVNVRVVQKNLVFVVGLTQRLADQDMLKKPEYFGRFGKIHKVVVNNSTSYAGSQQGPSASAYLTYQKAEDSLRAIQSVNNITVDGRTIKASLGTTKYCSHFLKGQQCPKVVSDCMYLHELGDEAASFTKEEMQAGKHQEYERKLHEQFLSSQNQQKETNRQAGASPTAIPQSQNSSKDGWPALQSSSPNMTWIDSDSCSSADSKTSSKTDSGRVSASSNMSNGSHKQNSNNEDNKSDRKKQQNGDSTGVSSWNMNSNPSPTDTTSSSVATNNASPHQQQAGSSSSSLSSSYSDSPPISHRTHHDSDFNADDFDRPPQSMQLSSSPNQRQVQINNAFPSLTGLPGAADNSFFSNSHGFATQPAARLELQQQQQQEANNPEWPSGANGAVGEGEPNHLMTSETLPVDSHTDWQAAFGFASSSNNMRSDDDLGFDPWEASNRALTDMMVNENQQTNYGSGSIYGMSQNHHNLFGGGAGMQNHQQQMKPRQQQQQQQMQQNFGGLAPTKFPEVNGTMRCYPFIDQQQHRRPAVPPPGFSTDSFGLGLNRSQSNTEIGRSNLANLKINHPQQQQQQPQPNYSCNGTPNNFYSADLLGYNNSNRVPEPLDTKGFHDDMKRLFPNVGFGNETFSQNQSPQQLPSHQQQQQQIPPYHQHSRNSWNDMSWMSQDPAIVSASGSTLDNNHTKYNWFKSVNDLVAQQEPPPDRFQQYYGYGYNRASGNIAPPGFQVPRHRHNETQQKLQLEMMDLELKKILTGMQQRDGFIYL